MGRKKLQLYRKEAFAAQRGKCFYCFRPMWLDDKDEFASTYQISRRMAGLFQCTAEHLKAKCDGGKDRPENIVAACKYCNGHRHRRKRPMVPEAYQLHVRRRIAAGRWLH